MSEHGRSVSGPRIVTWDGTGDPTEPAEDRWVPLRGALGAWSCVECGAVVPDWMAARLTHERWHRELVALLQEWRQWGDDLLRQMERAMRGER